jgi:hypothetical protein
MFPRHIDRGFHIVCQNDKLRRSASVVGAKWAASGRSPQSTQIPFYFIPSFSCIKRDGNFSVWIFRRALIYDSSGSAQTAPRKLKTRGLVNVLTLKTDKGARYYCSRCKAEMIVHLDMEELFIATCIEFDGDQNNAYDRVRIEIPTLKRVQCPNCSHLYKDGPDLLREIEHGTSVSCRSGSPLVTVIEQSDMVQEALRIFDKRIRQRTPSHLTKESNTLDMVSVILRCSSCRCLNRVADSPLRRNGFYSCGRCNKRFQI